MINRRNLLKLTGFGILNPFGLSLDEQPKQQQDIVHPTFGKFLYFDEHTAIDEQEYLLPGRSQYQRFVTFPVQTTLQLVYDCAEANFMSFNVGSLYPAFSSGDRSNIQKIRLTIAKYMYSLNSDGILKLHNLLADPWADMNSVCQPVEVNGVNWKLTSISVIDRMLEQLMM